jgi:dipeptidyl aminopeptidase/acylaminoacyl peptidase
MKLAHLNVGTLCGALLLGAVATPALAQQPPIIDRQAFFGDPPISGAQVSPDGRWMTFLKPYKGVRNIWVKQVSEPFSAARPLSGESKRPVSGYFWAKNSQFVLYAQDQGGDENYNIYAIDPQAPADPATGLPATRALTDLKKVRVLIYALPKSKPDILYIGLNDRDPRYHDLYELRLSTGQKTLLRQNTNEIAGWDFDNAGALRLASRTTKGGDTEILRVDANGFTPIYTCSVFESCGAVGFDGANTRAYLSTNKGERNLQELDSLEVATGQTRKIESDPQNHVDIDRVELSQDDYRILFTRYEDENARLYFRDKPFEADYAWLKTKLPNKDILFGSRSADDNVWLISARSDVDPGTVYLWNRAKKTLDQQYHVREELPRDAMSTRRAYSFTSSDGLKIPAFLTLPKGLAPKNLPLIVYPHGGPWAHDSFGMDGFAQFLANRGYAVLQPNFRGSTGYGKAFLNAGNGEWGRKMQDDLTWGVKALVAQGVADPRRVGIYGGSYGGYATLAGVAFTPKVYAAGASVVGPSNLLTLLDAIPPYWEAGRKQMYARMADPNTPAGKALLIAESPLTRARDIETPLLVVQGKNDPRVHVRESDQIVAAVRDNGKPVEYLVAPDEGHGFARPINNLAMVTVLEKFLADYLGGRAQQDVPADVAAQIKLLTVDPKTVVADAKLTGALAEK